MTPETTKLKVVDLFSGAGGMSLGFQSAGFDIVAAFDRWDAAVKCYSRNFPGQTVFKHDLSDVTGVSEILRSKKFDVIIGGPPCQDFSTAGKQVEGERANLTKSFAKIVAAVRPKYFVMENVQSAQRSKAFAAAKGMFRKAGYGLTEIVIDASFCGVPQRRKRLFCIGLLNGEDNVLEETLLTRQSDLPRTARDCLEGQTSAGYYYVHPRTYRRRAVYSLDEPAPTVRSGGNRPMPNDYKRHPADPVDPREGHIRALTMEERAALQMFPSNYMWGENRADNELLISNAVPVGLARFVGEALLAFATDPTTAPRDCFLTWLCAKKNCSRKQAHRIISGYRRANSLLCEPYSTDKRLLWGLVRCEAFKGCSRKTRMNLVSACKMHLEFETWNATNKGKQHDA